MRERLILKRVFSAGRYLNDHRDWWLPVFTTFLGVFLAALATIYLDKLKSDETLEKLLKFSLEEVCVSWSTVDTFSTDTFSKARQLEVNMGALKNLGFIPTPSITNNAFKQNPAILADLHPLNAIDLVRALSGVGRQIDDVTSSLSELHQSGSIEVLRNTEIGQLPPEIKAKVRGTYFKVLRLEQSLTNIAFLLLAEIKLRNGEFSYEQFGREALAFPPIDNHPCIEKVENFESGAPKRLELPTESIFPIERQLQKRP